MPDSKPRQGEPDIVWRSFPPLEIKTFTPRRIVDVPERPLFGDVWSEHPLPAWRRYLMLGAERLLQMAGSHLSTSVRDMRLRHRKLYAFDGEQWINDADGCWSTISGDGCFVGVIAREYYTAPAGLFDKARAR